MTSQTGTVSRHEALKLQALKLHEHYSNSVKSELDFFFRYFNFYVGLLSALLAASITGFFQFRPEMPRALILLIGPAFVLVLAFVGWRTCKVFYQRFLEAWITALNLQEMLGFTRGPRYGDGLREPSIKGKTTDSFVAEFEITGGVRRVVERARIQGCAAEEVLKQALLAGETLRLAKLTFVMFGGAALVAAVTLTIYYMLPRTASQFG
jgi:hypothetical protein